MSVLLAYWIAVSAVGFAAAYASLWHTYHFAEFLKNAPNRVLKHPREVLVAANHMEAVRDWFLVSGLGVNLLIGIASAFASTKIPAIRSITGSIALVGLIINATILAVAATFNYWLRNRS